MLTIIKINEGYCVVDLDEDTEVFDSLEECQEIVGGIISERMKQDRYDKYIDNLQTSRRLAAVSDAGATGHGAWPNKLRKDIHNKAREDVVHREKRLKQRKDAASKMSRETKAAMASTKKSKYGGNLKGIAYDVDD